MLYSKNPKSFKKGVNTTKEVLMDYLKTSTYDKLDINLLKGVYLKNPQKVSLENSPWPISPDK